MRKDEDEKEFDKLLDRDSLKYGAYIKYWNKDDIQIDGDLTYKELRNIYLIMKDFNNEI